MGVSQSSSVDQNVLNDVAQNAETTCEIKGTQDISNTTIMKIGGSGGIELVNKLDMSDNKCDLSATLDSQVETTLKALLEQKKLSITAILPDLDFGKQSMSIAQTIKSSVAQSSFSSCKIGLSQDIHNNYILAKDNNANIRLANEGTLDNSSCVMSNALKSLIVNKADAEGKQSSTSVSGLILIAIAAVVVVILVAGVIFLKKGAGSGMPAGMPAGKMAPKM